MNELIPDWLEDAPPHTPVTTDKVLFFTKSHAIPLPVIPHISLSQMVRWLAGKAEALGVEVRTFTVPPSRDLTCVSDLPWFRCI